MPRQTTFLYDTPAQPQWHHFDATGKPMGRLAVEIATVLMGKHRPDYTPHTLTGDFVVVTNSDKVALSGRKADQKIRLRYTYHPGGLKKRTYGQVLATQSDELLRDAVRRMIPKNRIAREMITRLKIYRGDAHPHQAQRPVTAGA